MAFNLGFPLVGAQVPGIAGASATPRRPWQSRLFDRLVPESSASLIGVNDADKKALVRQGLLQLAAGIQSSPNFGQGLTQGLLAGSQSLNQGLEDVQARRLREQQLLHLQNSGLPTEYRSLDLMAKAAGHQPGTPGYRKFFEVKGGLAARAMTGARKNVEIVGADGVKRPGVFDPSSPYGYSVYDESVGQFRPLEAGESPIDSLPAAMPTEAPAQNTPASIGPSRQLNPYGDFSALSSQFGLKPTSVLRSPQHNAEVGGVPNSFHLTGQAADWVVPPQQKPQFVAQARQMGYQAIDEGDHVHIEPPGSPPRRPAAPAGLAVGRSPEAQAFATESAQQRAQIAAIPQRNALEVQLAGQKAAVETAAKATAERQQEAITALPTVLSTSGQIDNLLNTAINHPGRATATGMSSTLDPRNYLKGTDARDFGVLLDQIKGQAFLQAFQSLRGSGAITEREGQAATNAIARLNTAQSDDAFVQALKDLQKINASAQERAIQKAQGRSAQAPAAPKTIRYDAKGNRLP